MIIQVAGTLGKEKEAIDFRVAWEGESDKETQGEPNTNSTKC